MKFPKKCLLFKFYLKVSKVSFYSWPSLFLFFITSLFNMSMLPPYSILIYLNKVSKFLIVSILFSSFSKFLALSSKFWYKNFGFSHDLCWIGCSLPLYLPISFFSLFPNSLVFFVTKPWHLSLWSRYLLKSNSINSFFFIFSNYSIYF